MTVHLTLLPAHEPTDRAPGAQPPPRDASFTRDGDIAERSTSPAELFPTIQMQSIRRAPGPCIHCGAYDGAHDPGCCVTPVDFVHLLLEAARALAPTDVTLADLVATYDRHERTASR